MMMRLLIFTLIISFGLSACNDGQLAESAHIDGVLFATALPEAQSKVTGENWDGGDEIGVFMLDHGATSLASASNVLYTTTSGGSSTALFTGNLMMGSGTYDFVAYYPYANANSFGSVPLDVADQSKFSDIDFMYAFAENGGAGYNTSYVPVIDLPFEHKLSKVIFRVTAGDGISNTYISNMSVYIDKLYTDGTFDLTNTSGTGLTLGSSLANEFYIPSNGNTREYEAIVMPQPIGSNNIVHFDLLGNGTDVLTYQLDNAIDAFTAGNNYIFDIYVSRTGISLIGNIAYPWVYSHETGVAE